MKKEFALMVCAWLLCIGHVLANELTIGHVTVPQGGTTDLTVGYRLTGTTDKVGFTFALDLPKGITLLKDVDGDPVYAKNETSIGKLNIVFVREGIAGQPSNENAIIKGTEGSLLTLTLKADASLAVGSTYTVSVTKVSYQEKVENKVKDINLGDFTFTVTVGVPTDNRMVLDETSASAPEDSNGAVDVRVKRTIKAGEWSTICLPFAMTEAQVKAAFGKDVQIGDFDGCVVEDETGNITAKFVSKTAIEANHPYIIKVMTSVTEFTADGVSIAPEKEPAIDKDFQETGTGHNKKITYNSFIGNYINGTVIPDYALFLADNKFWFSTGATKIKAFRAYFDIATVGAEYDESELETACLAIAFEDNATGIADNRREAAAGHWYNLNGQRVQKPGKGIYVREGKKVIKE